MDTIIYKVYFYIQGTLLTLQNSIYCIKTCFHFRPVVSLLIVFFFFLNSLREQVLHCNNVADWSFYLSF